MGYKVFPCKPGEKVPMTPNGFKDALTDTDKICEWWERWPDANIGLATEGLAVIDVDGADNGWPFDNEKAQSLAVGPLSLTPRGGRHHIFRQPAGKHWGNTAGTIAQNVDSRGYGGYILVPPSQVGGKPYQWARGYELDGPLKDQPEPPGWLIGPLDGEGSTRKDPIQPGAEIPSGQRNATLARMGGALRRIGLDYEEIYSTLLEVNQRRCHPPIKAPEIAKIARSMANYEPDQVAVALIEEDWEDVPDLDQVENPGDEFPPDLLNVPGFMGEVMEYDLDTAFKPQPVLSLGAALCLQATLAARKVKDSRGNRTNLYIIGVGDSGSGKDNARKVNRRILLQAGLEDLEGEEDFASDSGLLKAVEHNPGVLFQIDEIGRMLKTIAEDRHGYLYNIATVLMKLYSCANTVFRGKAYADDKRNSRIIEPCVSLYGMTVPEHFYQSLTPIALQDGFLARIIVLEAIQGVKRIRTREKPPPKSLVEVAKWWGNFNPCPGNLTTEYPKPQLVDYTDEAWDVFDAISKKADDESEKGNGPTKALWARAEEKACRLALIFACSRNRKTLLIDLEAAEWARELVYYTTKRMLWLASEWVAENPFDAKQKNIIRMIREAGGSMTKWVFNRRTKAMTARERLELVESMKSSGLIREDVSDNLVGRKGMVYKLI